MKPSQAQQVLGQIHILESSELYSIKAQLVRIAQGQVLEQYDAERLQRLLTTFAENLKTMQSGVKSCLTLIDFVKPLEIGQDNKTLSA